MENLHVSKTKYLHTLSPGTCDIRMLRRIPTDMLLSPLCSTVWRHVHDQASVQIVSLCCKRTNKAHDSVLSTFVFFWWGGFHVLKCIHSWVTRGKVELKIIKLIMDVVVQGHVVTEIYKSGLHFEVLEHHLISCLYVNRSALSQGLFCSI